MSVRSDVLNELHAIRGDTAPYFVIYKSPTDAPGQWVIRRWTLEDGKLTPGLGVACKTLTDARALLPKWASTKTPRRPSDDPAVHETWA